ncbi:MAG: hypothetical protein Kow00106_18500 [Anaerolineae bacterium]
MQSLTISFGTQQATAVKAQPHTPPDQVLAALGLPPFRGVIVIHGGAGAMERSTVPAVSAFLADAVVPLAQTHQLLVADGATQTGVARLMGEVRAAARATFPLLGVAPQRYVTYPGGPPPGKERYPLNPHHSHFIFVEGDSFGVESALLVGLLRASSAPGFALIVNGGKIVMEEARAQAAQGNPVVILRGSGRAADRLADSASAERASLPAGARLYLAEVRAPAAFGALARRLLSLPAP